MHGTRISYLPEVYFITGGTFKALIGWEGKRFVDCGQLGQENMCCSLLDSLHIYQHTNLPYQPNIYKYLQFPTSKIGQWTTAYNRHNGNTGSVRIKRLLGFSQHRFPSFEKYFTERIACRGNQSWFCTWKHRIWYSMVYMCILRILV